MMLLDPYRFGGGTPGPSFATEILADAPLAWWQLRESSGNFADSSGNGRTGVVAGSGIDYDRSALFPGTLGAASFGGAASFSCADPFGTSYNADLSIMCAFRVPAVGAVHGLSSRTDASGSGWSVQLQVRANGAIGFFIVTTGGGVVQRGVETSAADIVAGMRYVVHAVWDAGVGVYVYINGVLKNTSLFTAGTLRNGSGGVSLTGGRAQSNFGTAVIDELAWFNTALSGARVAAHYAAAVSP